MQALEVLNQLLPHPREEIAFRAAAAAAAFGVAALVAAAVL